MPEERGPVATARAHRATYVAFAGAGVVLATWASRIPQVRDDLGLDASELGLVLLAVAAGSVVALPLSGVVVARLGSRRTLSVMAVTLAAGLAVVAFGLPVGVAPVVAGLWLLGFANGTWDVAMNVQGAVVERALGRSVMARYHAGFSLGTVVGALVGAGMAAAEVPVSAHLVVVAVLVAGVVLVAVRSFLPDVPPDRAPSPRSQHALLAWTEPRTLLVGLVVLAFAFAEGTANDWVAIGFVDDYRTSDAVGVLGFAAFLTAMTAARWAGPGLLDRHGRPTVVRVLAAVAAAGAVLFAVAPATPWGFVGVVLWGVGTSLGFPAGMSAAADDPALAAPRVSVVASIGYTAFLAGPPLIGFLSDELSVRRSVLTVAVLLAAAALLAARLAPLHTPEREASRAR